MFLHVAHKLFGQKKTEAHPVLAQVCNSWLYLQAPLHLPGRGNFGVHDNSRKLYKLNMSDN